MRNYFVTTSPLVKFFFVVILCILTGCAANSYRQGLSLLDKESYEEAIELLETAEKEKPNDARIKRDLGMAYYKAGRFDDAINKLEEAKTINLKDSKTVFYLGLSYEAKHMLDEAINEYKNYNKLSRTGGFRKEISKRIRQLTNEKVSEEIVKAISQESALDVAALPENTVAVLYFRNLGTSRDLDPLQKGIAEMLITDLSKARKLRVVERLKLQKLLEELELGTTGLVDDQSAPRVGKLLGARKLINGGFTDLTDENLRIDASLAETATAEIAEVEEITGKLNALFQLEKNLVFKVIDELGIRLTKEEREEIQKIPTESLLAFIAYSKGLDYEDRGLYDQARQEYENAISLDPNFKLAKESLDEVEIAQSAAAEAKVSTVELENEFESAAQEVEIGGRTARLLSTSMAAQTGQTPQGDNDTREPFAEATGSDNITSNNARIIIRIPLPETP